LIARERSLLIGAVCVLCGVSVGYLIGRFMQTKDTIEAVETMRDLQHDEAELDAEGRLREIELAEAGKNDTIVRANCALLFVRLRQLNPTDFGDRADKIKQLVDRAQSKVVELQKAGHCPFGPAAKP
jgi:hypothetical protein